ncbi:MAG: magnesium/cobalt transporter CorA [Bacteroidia bacterium]
MVLRKRQTTKIINPDDVAFVGTKYSEKIDIQLFEYNSEHVLELVSLQPEELPELNHPNKFYWLNIHGIHDTNAVRQICNKYNIHRLIIRDVIDTNQRPKIQEFDDCIFLSLKSILPSSTSKLSVEQISFILTENALITFQEKKSDHFKHVRERLRKKMGLVRNKPADYLMFLLIESIIHSYYESVDSIEEHIDNMMDNVSQWSADTTTIHDIERYRKELFKLNKMLKPLKEALSTIEKLDNILIKPEQRNYFFDLKEQALDLIESVESLKYRLESAVNLFFSMQGHKMNQIMKTLTVVATIFIPLTFIVGVYGMNFENMPELKMKWGYLTVWIVMLLSVLGMVLYFRWKKWD